MKMSLTYIQKPVATILLVAVMLLTNVPGGLFEVVLQSWQDRNVVDVLWQAEHSRSVVDSFRPSRAYAAEASIDATVNTTIARHTKSSKHIVCLDDTDCYAFYIDSTNDVVYQHSTNGGASWGGAGTTIKAGTYEGLAVWYDRWTPGDTTGNYIHIAHIDTNEVTPDRIWYTRFDTTNDSFSTPVDASGAAEGLIAGTNDVTVTKGTDGDLYVGEVNATAPSAGANFVEKCPTGSDCTSAGNWVAAGSTNPWDGVGDDTDGIHSLTLLPLSDTAAHDTGDMMLVSYDVADGTVEYKVYDDSADTWSTNFTNIDTATDNTTYRNAIGGTVNPTTGELYMTWVQNPGTTNTSEVRAWKYNDSWSQLADPWPDTTDGASLILDANIGVDSNTADLYVVYIRDGSNDAVANNDVYYNRSQDDGSTWDGETLLSDGTDGDHRGVSINASSGERLYAVWYDPTPDDIFGGVVADLTPPSASAAPARTIRLFEGFKINLVSGTLKINQQ